MSGKQKTDSKAFFDVCAAMLKISHNLGQFDTRKRIFCGAGIMSR